MELEECYEVCPGDKGLVDVHLRPKVAGEYRYNLRRKAGAVEHPEAPTRARRRRLRKTDEDDQDAMMFAQTLEAELLCYFGTENLTGSDDDDDVMEISRDEFLGSSAPAAVPPRTAAQPGTGAASCVQTSSSSQHDQSTDGDDVVEFCHEIEKSVQPSSPERSSTPKSALTDDEDDEDMCGLACPPMDEAYVELIFSEPLVQFDPTFIEEFLSDL